MNTKILLSLVAGAVVVVGGAYFVLAPYAKTVEEAEYVDTPTPQKQGITEGAFAPQFAEEEKSETIVSESIEAETKPAVVPPKEVVAPALKPAVVPTPVTPKPAASLYTVATVATHNSETSCWSIINGNVYDLTSFIPKHPGGDRNILKICGKDGTSAFMGQHGGDSKPETTLAKHFLGTLSQ